MGAKTEVSPFPGAKRYSEQVFLFEYPESMPSHNDDPSIIILFGWGDGQPKHVTKYIAGYKTLFPSVTKIVVVLATTLNAAYQPLDERVAGMMPVIDAAFPDGPILVPANNSAVEEAAQQSRVLLHTMSNAGGINLASALHAYKQRFGTALPHRLLVLDSTPGGVVFHEQVGRWARAMAIGMSRNFPWPYFVTYGMCYTLLWIMKGWDWICRRQHAGAYSRRVVNEDGDIIVAPARRLYVYSKEDDIILWNDIETHAAEARSLGFGVELHMFEGSDHVGHLRRHPDEYWRVIAESWKGLH